MSPACARPTSGPFRGLMVISALWRCFSTARTTLVSNLSPKILRIFAKPVSTSLRIEGVISHCLPVYSTFIQRPFSELDYGWALLADKRPALLHDIYFFTRRWWVLGM